MNPFSLRLPDFQPGLLTGLLLALCSTSSTLAQEPVPEQEPAAPTLPPAKVVPPVPAPEPAAPELPTLSEAMAMLEAQDLKGAINAFTKITVAQPDNGRAWFYLGYAVHMHGQDWPRAIELHKKAATYPNEKMLSLYNLACAYSRAGDQCKALETLGAAIDAGFDRIVKVNTDPDLIELRKTDAFRAYWATTGLHKKQKDWKTPDELVIRFEERQLDFLVGEWNVYVDSRLARASSIGFTLGGQSLREIGSNFESTFTWVAEDNLWRQSWISHSGHHDLLEGKSEEGAVVLIQPQLRDHPGQIGRLTLRTVNTDKFFMGWQRSADGGEQWSSPYMQEYRRRSPLLRFPNQTLKGMSSEAPTQTTQYGFKLGRWDITCRSKSSRGKFNKGSGTSTCYFDEDGVTILDDLVVNFSNQRGFQGQTIRRFDAEKGHWVCSWNPKDGRSNDFIATFDPESGRMIESFTGTDYHGGYDGKLQFYEVSESAFHGRLDRNYGESGTQVGQWEYVATRMPQ